MRPKLAEKEFMAQVVQLARLCGWRVFHDFDSRKSAPGFPDLVLVRKTKLIFAELKTDRGRLTPDQEGWYHALLAVPGPDVYVWRPADWEAVRDILR